MSDEFEEAMLGQLVQASWPSSGSVMVANGAEGVTVLGAAHRKDRTHARRNGQDDCPCSAGVEIRASTSIA